MPGFNQTGPMGQGPMTGRRMGRCTNFGQNAKNANDVENQASGNTNEFIQTGRGLGYGMMNRFGGGRGMRMGRGCRNGFMGGR